MTLMNVTPEITITRSYIIGLDAPMVSPELPLEREFSKQLLIVPKGSVLPGTPPAMLESQVFVSVDWTRDGVIVSSALFEEEGYGRSYEEAWGDFLSSIRDRYESLAKREPRLSTGDKRVLGALRSALNLA